MPTRTMLRRARLAMSSQAAMTSSAKDELDITAVKSWNLREPVSHRSYTVIGIETRSGLKGYGECAPLSVEEFSEAKSCLMGRPATAYQRVSVTMNSCPNARAAANVAMLDIVAKVSRVAVFQLLGGPTRYKARAIARISGDSDSALTGAVQSAKQAGYRAFIVPAPVNFARNQGQAFVDAVLRRLDALRRTTGIDDDFVLDGGNRLTPGDAQMISAAIESRHLLWFNEPCPPISMGSLSKVAAESVTPLGIGRHLRTADEFQELLRGGSADMVRPDLGLTGISEARRMAAIAETNYVAVGPVHVGGPLGTAAALHLAASIPNFFIQEIPYPEAKEDRRMRAEIVSEPVEVVHDGFASLPVGQGLGVTVNEQALERYQERAA
jgi:galactonate dehydratase